VHQVLRGPRDSGPGRADRAARDVGAYQVTAASAIEIIGTGSVCGLRLRVNTIDATGAITSSTGTETIPVGAVVRSVGYRGAPLPGLPFDSEQGLVLHEAGRHRPDRGVLR
jgi:hypothetical protein